MELLIVINEKTRLDLVLLKTVFYQGWKKLAFLEKVFSFLGC